MKVSHGICGESERRVASIICGGPSALDAENVRGLVIAADRGLEFALAAGITPDIAAGDFDSSRIMPPEGMERVRVPAEKDVTDAWLAAEIAIERGCTELRFFCALGGRADHSAANLQMLYSLRTRGIRAEIFGERERIFFLRDETAWIERFDGYVSVFAFGGSAVASETGVKYPLECAELFPHYPLGVSNEVSEPRAHITAHSGTLMVMTVTERPDTERAEK